MPMTPFGSGVRLLSTKCQGRLSIKNVELAWIEAEALNRSIWRGKRTADSRRDFGNSRDLAHHHRLWPQRFDCDNFRIDGNPTGDLVLADVLRPNAEHNPRALTGHRVRRIGAGNWQR